MISHDVAAQASWLDQASSWAAIVGTVVALLAVALGFWVSSSVYQIYALLNRRRKYIGPVARSKGMSRSYYRFMLTCRQLLSRRVQSGVFQVSDELAWLSALNPTVVTEEGFPKNYPVPVPFTFALPEGAYSSTLRNLAAAYATYASSVRRRWLLRSAAGPLVMQEHECAMATASLLSRWASFEPVVAHRGTGSQLRGMQVKIGRPDGPWTTRLVAWPDMGTRRLIPGFPVIGVSYQPYRVVMDGSPAASRDAENKDLRIVPRAAGIDAASPLSFDGILPRWHGPGFRIEIDQVTGRQKLHLCISETTYFAFQATQEPARASQAGDHARCSRLLSLNLLALDQDGAAVLIRRSNYVAYPGEYSGTVSGNCELASREGLRADVDQFGLPDLLGAIAREAKEELGLDLTGEDSQLAALGVIEYSGAPELETHALVATARLPGRACDFRVDKSAPDPIEGAWEIGDKFMAIDLPAILRSRVAGEHFVRWLRSSDELAPQTVGSLLLLLTAQLELRDHRPARPFRNAFDNQQHSWTSTELAQWLKSSPPRRLVRPGKYVRYYPLWK